METRCICGPLLPRDARVLWPTERTRPACRQRISVEAAAAAIAYSAVARIPGGTLFFTAATRWVHVLCKVCCWQHESEVVLRIGRTIGWLIPYRRSLRHGRRPVRRSRRLHGRRRRQSLCRRRQSSGRLRRRGPRPWVDAYWQPPQRRLPLLLVPVLQLQLTLLTLSFPAVRDGQNSTAAIASVLAVAARHPVCSAEMHTVNPTLLVSCVIWSAPAVAAARAHSVQWVATCRPRRLHIAKLHMWPRSPQMRRACDGERAQCRRKWLSPRQAACRRDLKTGDALPGIKSRLDQSYAALDARRHAPLADGPGCKPVGTLAAVAVDAA